MMLALPRMQKRVPHAFSWRHDKLLLICCFCFLLLLLLCLAMQFLVPTDVARSVSRSVGEIMKGLSKMLQYGNTVV